MFQPLAAQPSFKKKRAFKKFKAKKKNLKSLINHIFISKTLAKKISLLYNKSKQLFCHIFKINST